MALPGAQRAKASELDDLQEIVDGVSRASSEVKISLLAAGFEEVARNHGWDVGVCLDAWGARGRSQREDPAQAIAAAYLGCEAMCPRGDIEATARAVVAANPRERTAVLVAACDAEGPDPVFTGDLAPLREQMSFTDFWAYRSMYATAFERLDAIGGERSAAVRTAHEEFLAKVARALANTEDGRDLVGLAELCSRVRADHPHDDLVTVSPDPGVPYADVLAVFEAARGVAFEKGWKEGEWFGMFVLEDPSWETQ